METKVGLKLGFLKQFSNVTLEEELIGWWKFDEVSGINAVNSVSGESSGTLIDSNFSSSEKKFGDSALHLPSDKRCPC